MGKKKIRPIQIKSNPITKTLCTALKDRCTYSMNIQFLEGTVMNALADGYEMPEICEDGDLKFYKRMWGGDDDIFIAKWYKGVPIVFYKIKGMLLKYPTLKMSTINTSYCIKTAKEYLNILCKKGSKIINKDYESLLQYNIGTMAHLQDKRIIGKPKTMNDVFINNTDKQRIIKSLDNFKNKRNWYLENGIPYHFGILLYGPPGTGKTTLARAIGNYLKARQYIFTGDSINMLPRALNEQMLCVSPTQLRCVIVEDIDVGFKEQRYVRDSGTGDKDDKRSGFASLLNSFDGFLAPQDVIYIFTTNHIEKLDPALHRPGRIDLEINVNKITVDTLSQFTKKFYNKTVDESIITDEEIPLDLTFAKLQIEVMNGKSFDELISYIKEYKHEENHKEQ